MISLDLMKSSEVQEFRTYVFMNIPHSTYIYIHYTIYSGLKLRQRLLPHSGFDHVTQSHKEIGEAKQMRETS